MAALDGVWGVPWERVLLLDLRWPGADSVSGIGCVIRLSCDCMRARITRTERAEHDHEHTAHTTRHSRWSGGYLPIDT